MNTRHSRGLIAATSTSLLLMLAACSQGPEAPATTETPAPAPAEPVSLIVYENARLITGDGSAPIERATFTVDDGHFVAVGAAGEIDVPPGATHVDLSGMTVMPAIIDAHTHLSTTRDGLIEDLERRAYWGIGAALSLGADGDDAPLELRDEALPNAARYRSAGLGITSPEPGRRHVHWVTSVPETIDAVRTEAARHVDLIKVWVDDRDGQYVQLSPELYSAAIDEAHRLGFRVAAHIFDLADAKGLLDAGIDIFAHGVRDRDVDDEFVAMLPQHPYVVLIPNMAPRGVVTNLDWLEGWLPADELATLRAGPEDPAAAEDFYQIQARNLARMKAAGTTIAFGTDGNTPWAPHVELEDMVAAGMTPAAVLVSATRNAAAVAHLPDMGTIAPHKSADFLVLEANPLDDITNTRRISAVYLRGEPVDRAALRARWGGKPHGGGEG